MLQARQAGSSYMAGNFCKTRPPELGCPWKDTVVRLLSRGVSYEGKVCFMNAMTTKNDPKHQTSRNSSSINIGSHALGSRPLPRQ